MISLKQGTESSHIHRDQEQNDSARSYQEGRVGTYLMGTEFQFMKMEMWWGWKVMTVVQWEHAQCHQTVHLKMVEMVNLRYINHNKKYQEIKKK